MKMKNLLFAGVGLTLLALGIWCAVRPAKRCAAEAQREANERLRTSVQSQPRPGLTNLPALLGRAAAADTNTAATAGKTALRLPDGLTEATLAPLRAAFVPPRFTERADLPAARQTLLSNRLLISPEARSIPKAASGKQTPSPRNTTPFMVQFNTPVSDASRQLLQALGATVRGYFPNNALLAELTPSALAKLSSVAAVQATEEFLPSDKLQPFLASLIASLAPEARVRVTLQTLAPEDAEPVAAAVRAAGGEAQNATSGKRWGLVHATLPLSAIRPLAARGEVQWIEERVLISTRNDKAAIGTHLNTTNVWQTWGLTGKGQIIGHADTGIDTGDMATMHPDFQGQILALIARARPGDASDPFKHGTHTAGSILGNGAASAGLYRGMAYGAMLVHQSVVDAYGYFTGFTDIYPLFEESYAYGARIRSDSWGSDTAGAYDSDCRSADLFAWDYPDQLACFASGNAGRDGNSDGVVDMGSVGSPASAKNVLAVGASENDRPSASGGYSSSTWYTKWPSSFPTAPIRTDLISYSATTSPYRQGMAAFSSRGPTQDGRIKPDLVTPGTDVISTKSSVGGASWGTLVSNTRYCFNGGTSMSTPLAAGTAALVRQYAIERGGVTNPSAALLKAMLIGGARSLTPGQYGTGSTREIPDASPNSVEGWGQPDIEATVHPAGRMVRLFDRMAPAAGLTNTYSLLVTVSNTPLDIALAWIDYPATAGAGVTRVNDFDLLVTSPSGTALYPNNGVARDSLNTVEILRLAAAQAGVYQVQVIGAAVPYAGSVAALYARGAIDAAPFILHTPLSAQSTASPFYRTTFLVQSLATLTNGEARLFWAAGTASAATGDWHDVAATWTGGAGYQADIPSLPPGNRVRYYLQALTGGHDVRLPATAPAATFSFYIGNPLELLIEGSPARYGSVTPPYGTNTVLSGVETTASATSAVILSNGLRRACAGWTGTGSVPASGATNACTFTPDQASSLTWQWQVEFALTNRYRLADTGEIFGEQVTWHADGTYAATETALELGFVDSVPYAFCGWSVDGERWPDASSAGLNPATGILMDKPRLAQGDYLPFWLDSDNNLLGDWWELRYFGSTIAGVWDSDDLDGDGWTNLGEYLDNSDPLNPASQPAPPVITFTPLAPFQSQRSPWTVRAQITDNLTVEQAFLIWRERDDAAWQTNAMTVVSNTTFEAVLAPPSFGAKRVDYYLCASDLVGYYEPIFATVTPLYSVAGDYDTPWMSVTPQSFPIFEVGTAETNASLSIANLAGPDLVWTARVAAASARFDATNSAWTHGGQGDPWHVDTGRTWNGDAVWYCGNSVSRLYPNSCHAWLDTPSFRVGSGGGLLFRQWIKTESDAAPHFWDGAVLRISTDGGSTFTTVEPVGGYPYLIVPNPASPFPDDQPCLAGNGEGWQTVLLDLAAFAGRDVIIRFEFGSDEFIVEEGWYLSHVTPFSTDEPLPAWLQRQGAWGGVLPDTWSAPAAFRIVPSGLDFNAEELACLRVTGNDPTAAPLVPVTVRRGHILTVEARGPGTALSDRSYLFRDATATVQIQADSGAYLYGLTINGVPQQGVYDYETLGQTLVFANLSEDLQVIAWFGYRTWTLTVSSLFSTATPEPGTYTLPHGTLINASVAAPVALSDSIRRDCGWTLTSPEVTTGNTAQVAFALTNDTDLTWNWHFSFKLTAIAGANGTVFPTNAWYSEAQTAVLTAYPSSYYHFDTWGGDTYGAGFDGLSIILPMIEPRTVTAAFAPNLTPTHSVPEHWLAAHGWTQNFDQAAESDADADGMTTWAEWQADTDPTDSRSRLTFTGFAWTHQTPSVTWIGGVVRTQLIERASRPTGPWLAIHTNLPPTPITNALARPSTSTNSFYRIRIP